jgi:hypothetical protein
MARLGERPGGGAGVNHTVGIVLIVVAVGFMVFLAVYGPHDLERVGRRAEHEDQVDELWDEPCEVGAGRVLSSDRGLGTTATAGADDFGGGVA